jgi:hypothetical protein
MSPMPFHHAAAVVLHWAGQDGGYPAGSFVSHLLEAFSCADPKNFYLLHRAFPNLGAAMVIYKHIPDGTAFLQRTVTEQVEFVGAYAPDVLDQAQILSGYWQEHYRRMSS